MFNARDLGKSVSANGVARSENCLGGGKINYFSFALPARNFANFILLLASPPPWLAALNVRSGQKLKLLLLEQFTQNYVLTGFLGWDVLKEVPRTRLGVDKVKPKGWFKFFLTDK